MTLVINSQENKSKEKYMENDYWIQHLFKGFYIANRHLPHEIKAMREAIYEKTGIKVEKPVFSRTKTANTSPSEGYSEELNNKIFENNFDWSNYEK